MAPGGVRSDKDDQVRLIKVGIGSGHHILAKGADVSCDRARHAQAGVGVDVAAADEALHQLVRDVIILRQQLPRDIEGDAVRPVLLDRPGKGAGNEIESTEERRVGKEGVSTCSFGWWTYN